MTTGAPIDDPVELAAVYGVTLDTRYLDGGERAPSVEPLPVPDWPTLLADVVAMLPSLPTPEQIMLVRKADGAPSHLCIELAAHADVATWAARLGGESREAATLTAYRDRDGANWVSTLRACLYRGWWVHLDAKEPAAGQLAEPEPAGAS